MQLFVEAMGLAVFGVLAGVTVGISGAFVGQLMGSAVAIDAGLLLLTATTSLAVSVVACLIPALMAGRVEPAPALRL